ncbi:Solute carrier family 25 member 40 [Varanus komodoensis]|nr:Solute carrier family 25 member 40 [Varanus komodoensis]
MLTKYRKQNLSLKCCLEKFSVRVLLEHCAFSLSITVFSATIISPVEMIRTRIQSQRLTYKELGACIRSNVAKNGWLSLWKGWGPTVLRDVPFSALYWWNYEYFKTLLCKKSDVHEPTILITFSSGAAAGSIAALLTLPFDVVKTHTQTELWDLDVTPSSQQRKASVWKLLKRIVAKNGFCGLFTGIIPRLTKIAPACAIMISTYEYGKFFFHRLNKDKDPDVVGASLGTDGDGQSHADG